MNQSPVERGLSDTTLPRTRAKREAIADEQHIIDRIYARVERLRDRARAQVTETNRGRGGSTFQAQYERDVMAFHHATRAQEFTLGDIEALAFGRIDGTDGGSMYIGRRGVIDASGDALLVDWRAPVSEAFYQASAHDPRGLARRRTLSCHGQELRDLDDEILDGDAANALGIVPVNGDGALISALNRERSHAMRDIVATIQAEQDRIIRAPANGTLIVTGGPGTGKTVVALHRVASLLYRDRSRYAARGVLVIGPSQAFTAYTSRVLPALGETAVVQRPIAALAPRGVRVDGWSPADIGAITGSLGMVELARQIVYDALPALPAETHCSVLGTSAMLTAAKLRQVREQHFGALNSGQGSYHARFRQANDALFGAFFSAWRRARQQAGYTVSDTERAEFFAVIPDMPQVRMLLHCFWPALDVNTVLARLFAPETDVEALAKHAGLNADDASALACHWQQAKRFTVDDVGLVDEVAALIGPVDALVRREDDPELAFTVERDEPGFAVGEGIAFAAWQYRDFAHVVVDEAQDLTPMQWRAVSRRGPYATFTVVGDLAQRSRAAEPQSWKEIAALIGRRQVEVHTLSVNYRTPSEIATVAQAIVAANDPEHAQHLPLAVRSTGELPRLVHTADILHTVRSEVSALLDARDGTLAVIAPQEAVGAVAGALHDVDTERVRVLDPRTTKGLEFDDVVVVSPEQILDQPLGHALLYVATTRPTRTLTFVTQSAAAFPGSDRCVIVKV